MTLSHQKCEPCEGIGTALNSEQVKQLMPQLAKAWEVTTDFKQLKRSFQFKNFYETMAFVNAIAWFANQDNHHPDLEIGYNYCHVTYMTHALQGLTQNDFISASKIDGLL